jgi:hypothetical protein
VLQGNGGSTSCMADSQQYLALPLLKLPPYSGPVMQSLQPSK